MEWNPHVPSWIRMAFYKSLPIPSFRSNTGNLPGNAQNSTVLSQSYPIRDEIIDPLNASPGRHWTTWKRCSDPHHVFARVNRISSRLSAICPSRPTRHDDPEKLASTYSVASTFTSISAHWLSGPLQALVIGWFAILDSAEVIDIGLSPHFKHPPSHQISSPEFSNEFQTFSQA
jgi:hypothetical protein